MPYPRQPNRRPWPGAHPAATRQPVPKHPAPQRFAISLPASKEPNAPSTDAKFMAPCQEVAGWPPVCVGGAWWSAGYTTRPVSDFPISRGGRVKDAEAQKGFHAFSLKYDPKVNSWKAFQQNCQRSEAGAKVQAYRWYCHKAGISWKDPMTGKVPPKKRRKRR